MSDLHGQERPDFAPPQLRGPVMPTTYIPAVPAGAPLAEPVGPRLTMRTGAAMAAGVMAILVISVMVTLWATSPRPQSAMPAAWTAGTSAPVEPTTHLTVPVATGNRATTTPAKPSNTPTGRATTTGTVNASTTGSTKPAATSIARLPTCSPGQTLVTASWAVKIPAGWSCPASSNGDGTTQLLLFDAKGDMVVVSVVDAPDPATACSFGLAGQDGVNTGPNSSWGGKSATNVSLDFEAVLLARCVESKGSIYMMLGEGPYETPAQTLLVMDALSAAWVWK